MMEARNRSLVSAGSLVLLAVLFIALSILSTVFLSGMRIDLTENKLYTLSEGTRNILKNMDEPVTLRLYFSEDVSRDLPQFRSYARWAGEMLDEFADRSNGKLRLQRIDPKPFSTQEDRAASYGLQSAPVGSAGEVLYFGLVGTNSLDDQQVMPFMQPEKEKFLEYDLAKMVSTLSHPKHKPVGLISSLDMTPGYDPAVPRIPENWVIYQQLDQLFDLQEIPADIDRLPDDLELLILVHPKDLSDGLLYQIDQYVLQGGRLLAFIDPLAEADTGGNRSDPTSMLMASGSSTLEPLLAAWGVGFDTTMVIGDRAYALQVNSGPGQPVIRHLGILSVNKDGMNDTDVASADLEIVNFSSTGWLVPLDNNGDGQKAVFEPLVQTSNSAAGIEASRLRFLTNPQDLEKDFQPSGDRYVLAARITGQVNSAYEQAADGFDVDEHQKSSGDAGIQVVLFADTDILTDRLWIQKQNFLGQTVVNSFADNGTLIVNIADQMLGSQDLIRIRARASSSRPFDRVVALRLSAEQQFRDTEERLQQELEETERRLTEMQASRQDGELTVLNTDQQHELQRFLDRKLEIRSELRQVQHDLTRDIKALGMRLKFINIVLMPLLIILVALLFGHYRRKRREGGA